MSHIVVLGAGLGGTIMAYELRDRLGAEHRISVINKGAHYSFVPSNPWVAVGWRDRQDVEIDLGLQRLALFEVVHAEQELRVVVGGRLGHDFGELRLRLLVLPLVHEVDADLALGSRALELVLEELGKLRLGQAAFRVRTRSN